MLLYLHYNNLEVRNVELSANLKRIRNDKNLSQEDVAELVGVSRQAVAKWENGTAYD